MLVYTLLFTLAHKNPSENKYVDMLLIWLTYLLKYGGLDKSDSIAVLADTRTFTYIQEIESLSLLVDTSPCSVEFICIEPPLTLSEGMVQRYRAFQKHTTYLYLDLDILTCKAMKDSIPTLELKHLLVMPEGRLEDNNYAGLVLKGDIPSVCGFTSGWFAFTPCQEIQNLFEHIRSECIAQSHTPFYTVDQPFFNKWVWRSLSEVSSGITVLLMNDDIMENNSFQPQPSTVFMNYCGEPGKGETHATKMVGLLCLQMLSTASPSLTPDHPQEASAGPPEPEHSRS